MLSFERCVIYTICPYIAISFTLLAYKMMDIEKSDIKNIKHGAGSLRSADGIANTFSPTYDESAMQKRYLVTSRNGSLFQNVVSADKFIDRKPWLKNINIMSEKSDLDRKLNFVIYYKNFNITEPNFISTKDRREFFAMSSNSKYIGPQPKHKLKGVIQVIYDGIVNEYIDCGWPSNLQKFEGKGNKAQQYILSPFLVPDSTSFQHFMDGTLPKLMQSHSIISAPSVKLLIFKPRDNIIYEILEKINITRNKLVYYTDSITTKLQINSCITPPLHPLLWKKARSMLGVPSSLSIPVVMSNVVLLTRAHSFNTGRNMLNFQEVTNFLRQRYASRLIIFQGNYGLANSIERFGKSSIIIGVHGGAFYNLNFASEDTNIVEFLPVVGYANPLERIAHTIVWHMAQLLGQSYWRIHQICDINGDIILPLDKLKAVLDIIDLRLSNSPTVHS